MINVFGGTLNLAQLNCKYRKIQNIEKHGMCCNCSEFLSYHRNQQNKQNIIMLEFIFLEVVTPITL